MRSLRIGLFVLAIVLSLPPVGAAAPGDVPELFVTGDQCIACHNGLVTADGRDVSIGVDWRSSMMAHSARDPYWQAAVRREMLDHPESASAIEAECATCHMPMAHTEARAAGEPGRVFAHLPAGGPGARQDRLATDGVSCSMCHQITEERFGEEQSFSGGFVVDTQTPRWAPRQVYGRYEVDEGRQRIMRSATGFSPQQSTHVQRSELCATCHTLYTHTLGPGGEAVGKLPEQVPYLEWLHSDYADAQSCQDCHMRPLDDDTPIASVLGEARPNVSPHVFRGGNFFMLRMLNRFRQELGVEALPGELAASARQTVEHLREDAATIAIRGGRVVGEALVVDVVVSNLSGHKLPTAYPSRRAWLHVVVRSGSGRVVFESGELLQSGAIAGNDNDEDPRAYEPHHLRIERPEQVQIYEPIMATPTGEVTTGLLSASHYVKDNRLLPDGFEKASANKDIAVQGAASGDEDFVGGSDVTRYEVPVESGSGPFRVRAALWYQPISFRWAMNQAGYDAPETNRFTRYFESMSGVSGIELVSAQAEVRAPAASGGALAPAR